jgi:hypothetical protein
MRSMAQPPNSRRRAVAGAGEPPEERARGNFVSEWYGHRVYPVVASIPGALAVQKDGRCPFLSAAILQPTSCVKPPTSSGVCTISSSSNGPRQDWLVCPHRALDPGLLEDVSRRLFHITAPQGLVLFSAPTLAQEQGRLALAQALDSGKRVLVYLRNKLGGEISFSKTARSPEFSFDITVVEIIRPGDVPELGRYGIVEVQTMDFHGTYERAVVNLKDALRLHDENFHPVLQENGGRWLSERIEGPNIANVFKRTFYQMMLKFQVGASELSAGCVLALPAAVWDSWQRHLGRPELIAGPDGTQMLVRPEAAFPDDHVPAWIYVFDIVLNTTRSPNPIVIDKVIATDADSIAHFATRVAPQAALGEGGSAGDVLTSIRSRLARFWPDLAPPRRRRR